MRMISFKIGRIDGRWENFLPPIQVSPFLSLLSLDPVISSTATVSSVLPQRVNIDSEAYLGWQI